MKRNELLVTGLMCLIFSGFAQAGDKTDPTGHWKWSITRDDNVVVDFSLKLKLSNDKLIGTITIPNKDKIEIEEASFKDGEVKFSVNAKPR